MSEDAEGVLFPRELPGEREAIETVTRLGETFGFGRMIKILQIAWSKKLVESGLPRRTSDLSAGIICVWCSVDSRTGKKSAP